jgi:hypothetical protein
VISATIAAKTSRHGQKNLTGNIWKNMEKTASSTSYNQLLGTLDERLAEQQHRHLWLFLYATRHAQPHLHRSNNRKEIDLEESNRLIDETFDLLENFAIEEHDLGIFDENRLTEALHEFCFDIAYALHRKIESDSFIDVRFEPKLDRYLDFFDSLTPKEMAVIARLHELTYKYGFPITELWLPLVNSKDLLEIFTTDYPKSKKQVFSFPSFVFTKKGNHPKGIQISTRHFSHEIDETWDLAIFVGENDKLSHIKPVVGQAWNSEGKQTVGNPKSHDIALYIDRKICTISHALSTLRLQIECLSDHNDGLIFSPTLTFSKYDFRAKKYMHKKLSGKIDQIRLSEGIISKRWDIDKSNARRSIGLYLWDKINIGKDPEPVVSGKSLIMELISELKLKRPDILNIYLGIFNEYNSPKGTTKFGDLAESRETVIREMEADLHLTEYCIKNFEYLTPSDAKNNGKQNRKI